MVSFATSCQCPVIKPQTEEFLNFLLWSAETVARPTFRNLTDSYERWAYRNNLMRQVSTLEDQQLIERDPVAPDDRMYRLTWQGRLHALGGRDPRARWAREWDGRWRLVLFDVPITQNSHRKQLRRYLRDKGFGCLQNSVWITPDSLEEERRILVSGKINVESLVLLEARACAGESDAEIVAGAIQDHDRGLIVGETTFDPLLPEKILPPGYLGQQVWRRRIKALREAGRQLRTFNPFTS